MKVYIQFKYNLHVFYDRLPGPSVTSVFHKFSSWDLLLALRIHWPYFNTLTFCSRLRVNNCSSGFHTMRPIPRNKRTFFSSEMCSHISEFQWSLKIMGKFRVGQSMIVVTVYSVHVLLLTCNTISWRSEWNVPVNWRIIEQNMNDIISSDATFDKNNYNILV